VHSDVQKISASLALFMASIALWKSSKAVSMLWSVSVLRNKSKAARRRAVARCTHIEITAAVNAHIAIPAVTH
jgi:hypothetical protein